MTNEKKMQIAALNAQGKSIEEISELSGVNAADVEAFLVTRGRAPETRDEKVHRLAAEGMMQKDIAEKLGISRASVCKILKKKSFRLEETEKEPAPVEEVTDSTEINIPIKENTTPEPKSQEAEKVLKGTDILTALESMAAAMADADVDAPMEVITAVEACRERALVRFEYEGIAYELEFRRFRRCRDV